MQGLRLLRNLNQRHSYVQLGRSSSFEWLAASYRLSFIRSFLFVLFVCCPNTVQFHLKTWSVAASSGSVPTVYADRLNATDMHLTRRLHTEPGYGLPFGLWPTAVFPRSKNTITGNPAYLKQFSRFRPAFLKQF